MATYHFHPGEEFVQRETGEALTAAHNKPMVADRVGGWAVPLVQHLQLFFAASKDREGNVWASVLAGSEGFTSLPAPNRLLLHPSLFVSDPEDVFWKNIAPGGSVGLLFIDLSTRRRLRINGTLSGDGDNWCVEIQQAFPNCPKYIQRRKPVQQAPGATIGHDLKLWINKMDTFFVASTSSTGDLDVSHRGGHPGFIEWAGNNVLRIPDYAGNSMFNTLGNFKDNPAAGLLFVDFSNGDTLQMTGQAIIHLNEEGHEDFTGGTNRFWDFKIEQTLFKKSLFDFSARLIDYSPFNP